MDTLDTATDKNKLNTKKYTLLKLIYDPWKEATLIYCNNSYALENMTLCF